MSLNGLTPAPRNKYRAIPEVVDGHTFPSRKEARRYRELKLLERAGKIMHLTLQPRYELVVNGKKIGRYTGDFLYIELVKANYSKAGKTVLEECKGVKVRDYVLRRNLFCALFPDIEHREV